MRIPVEPLALVTIFLAATAATAATPETAAAVPKLRFTVILTRHGVRSPTWTWADLNTYSSQPWPDWGVAPGSLTPRGSTLMTLMGSYYRLYFANAGLLRSARCEDASHVHILADSESRTRETGDALAAGLMPGCAMRTQLSVTEKIPCSARSLPVLVIPTVPWPLLPSLDGSAPTPPPLVQVYRSSFDTLRELLFGCAPRASCPGEEKPGKRSVLKQLSSLETGKGDHSAELRGPLRIGSTLSEDFLLEYLNGMDGNDLGWGRLDADKLHGGHETPCGLCRPGTPDAVRRSGAGLEPVEPYPVFHGASG